MDKKLNILYYFAETGSYMHQWQRFHFIDELQQEGHRLTIYNPLSYRTLEEANESLPDFIVRSQPKFDVFMTASPSSQIFSETVQKVKAFGIPSLLICFDNLHAPFIHREIAPFFDLVWLTSSETTYLFKKWGCRTVFQPYAANPYLFRPSSVQEINRIGFAGTLYDDRACRINDLTRSGIPCTVYSSRVPGSGSKGPSGKLGPGEILSLLYRLSGFRIGRKVAYGRIVNYFCSQRNRLVASDFLEVLPSVPFEKINETYSGHALSINITELRSTFNLRHPVHKIHLRTFEIPMCGGLQIAPYVEELGNYFRDGEEIILCRDDEEFVSKARFYLRPDNASLRMKMKQNARKRAESDHTWNNRFKVVMNTLFGSRA